MSITEGRLNRARKTGRGRITEDAIMADQRLEFPPQFIPLDLVDHIAPVARTERNRVLRIHISQVRLDVFEQHLQVLVRLPAVLASNIISELMAVADTAADVGRDDDVALFGKGSEVPARGPLVGPRAIRAAVD